MSDRKSKERPRINDSQDEKNNRKNRNSVTALTKMFDPKNVNNGRRSVYNKMPINSKEKDNTPEKKIESPKIQRNRSSTIIDKISLFNKNAQPSAPVKKEEIIVAQANNYVKIVDEQTGKAKWVDGGNPELNSTKDKNENSKQDKEINSNSGKKQVDSLSIIKESNSIVDSLKMIEKKDIIVNNDIHAVNKEINENRQDSDSESCISLDIKSNNEEVDNANNNQNIKNKFEEIKNEDEESSSDPDSEDGSKIDIHDHSEDRIEIAITKSSKENKSKNKIDESNINKNTTKINRESIEVKKDIVPEETYGKNDSIDDGYISVDYPGKTNNDNEYVNVNSYGDNPKLIYNYLLMTDKSEDVDLSRSKNVDNAEEFNQVLGINQTEEVKQENVELQAEKNNIIRKKQDNIQDEFKNCLELRADEKVVNLSNMNLSQNYSSIMNTIKSEKDNVLFSERLNKNQGFNEPDDDFSDLKNSNIEDQNLLGSIKVKKFFSKYKNYIVILFITVIILIIIFLNK